MDESTLNELLECSVCLERLNTTSKVLPCQHTFCRGCLEVIVASRNELRCPECRVLVDIKIDELPPNVLLMRILEGLKNSSISGAKSMSEQLEKDKQTQKLTQQKSLNSSQKQEQQQLPTQTNVNTQRRCLLPHAYALYDFDSSEPTDLHFKKGDLILLKHKIDTNWFVGQLNGIEGTFPSNYVQVMVSLPAPQAIALYDFKMQPNEEEGCLNFKKGALVHVLRRVDKNWAEGRIGNAIGIFPIAFVELNALAKKLLERVEPKTHLLLAQNHHQQQQQQQRQEQQLQLSNAAVRNLPPIPLLDPTTNTSDTTTSPSSSSPSSHSNTTTSPSASENRNAASSFSNLSTNSNSLPNTPQHYAPGTSHGSVRYRSGREKRHSLNALLLNGSGNATPGLSILQTNRHSAEILSIPSEELFVDRTENQFAAAMPQSSAACEQRQSATATTLQLSASQHNTNTRANVLKSACGPTNVPQSLPWGYLALYPYKPRKTDELELKKGCVYIVTERCLDGWFKGKNWQDISGVFPGNYVTPLRARDQQQLMHQCKFVPQQSQSPSQPPINSTAVSLTLPGTNVSNLIQPKNSHSNSQQDQTEALPKPPVLPPRHAATTTTCASVWTKPLSHTVEAFFNRSSSSTAAKNDEKQKEKDTKSKDSASSGAVSLMKRLTHIKSRAKSPGAVARATAHSPVTAENASTSIGNKPSESSLQSSTNLQPVHIRSGSCPSQLLQNLPQNLTNVANHQTQQQPQQHTTHLMNHGSERIKGHKERPRIQAIRQSMDGTLRGGIYANINTTNATTAMITNNFQLNPKCAQQFQMQQQPFLNSPHSANHRKSHSLDANNMLSSGVGGVTANSLLLESPLQTTSHQPPLLPAHPLSIPNCNITAAAVAQSATTKSTHCGRESRFRCIVPYPPNSDVELELHVGDIIYVQRKQKNGWYKGTHARTQKTGLFPASFVEPDL